jgi:prolyl oligopeptidase
MSNADVCTDDDPFVWLEQVDSLEARAWVGARNAETKGALCDTQFDHDRASLLEILNARDRIPWVVQRGNCVYNFWQDEQNPKGLWRRTTLAS